MTFYEGIKSEFKGAVYGGETTTISNVAPGVEEYRVFHQGATGFVSIQAIRADAEKRSVEFCNRKNKMMKKLRETIPKPPYILGNFPRIEIVFACIAKSAIK